MVDFSFVTARLATGGGINSPGDVDILLAAGISHAIDCRIEANAQTIIGNRMNFLWLGVHDDGQPKPVEWFSHGIAFALSALTQPKSRVYAFCGQGVNRGPSITYSILRSFGLNPQQAEWAIRQARPQVGLAYMESADEAIKVLGYD